MVTTRSQDTDSLVGNSEKNASLAKNTKRERQQSSLAKTYLMTYNFLSFLGWAIVLGRVVLLVSLAGPRKIYGGVGEFTKYLQTAAVLEVVHSAVGLVPSTVFTTLVQVISRLVLVWGIVDQFPKNTQSNPAYASMLIAWSVTEVVRYSFYYFSLRGGVPSILTWLRYNTFLVLYPLGVASEMTLVYSSMEDAISKFGENAKYGWYAILATYFPGLYMLYGYMLKQRRRIGRGKQVKRT